MINDFVALQVFLPLLGAPLCVLLSRFGKFAWMLALTITWSVTSMCMSTFSQVMTSGEPILYSMGGWAAPFGIEYRIDMLSATLLMLISVMASLTLPYAFRSLNHELAREQQPYFYAAFLLFFAGLLGIVSTNDAFNIYVFLEISSLSSYVLIALGKDRRALHASFQYLVLGTIGATLLLIGIGLLYIMTGTLNITDMADRLADVADMRPVHASLAFITVGVCMKIALFPLHMWLPNAYSKAPSAVSIFLAAVSTKVGVYTLLRFFYTLYGYDRVFGNEHLGLALAAMAVAGILIGSAVAVSERNIKRMLAFSSIAQIGYITLGIGLASHAGLVAGVTHIINHAVIKGALFMALGCFAYRLGSSVTRNNICGMGKHMPVTSMAFVLAGLGIMGVPFTGGFISKVTLVTAVLDKEWWLVLAAIVISSLMAIIYIWRIVELLYFKPPAEKYDRTVEAPASMIVPLCIAVLIILWLGIDTAWNVEIAEQIAYSLMPVVAEGSTP